MIFNDLGLISYNEALEIQLEAVHEVLQGNDERVFLLEHYPVITLGRNQSREGLLVDAKHLYGQGIKLEQSSRGGDITCHFPGQLVVYPVVRIAKQVKGISVFFNKLEQLVINLLGKYNVKSARLQGMAGVYTNNGKIASMGIAVKKWVSYHGIALNLGRDLSLFDYINPCGFAHVRMTSIHRELKSDCPDMATLKNDFCQEFSFMFGYMNHQTRG